MNLIQVMLIDRLPHELADALVQSALGYQIRASTILNADSLIADRWPFSENGRSIKLIWTLVSLISEPSSLSVAVFLLLAR